MHPDPFLHSAPSALAAPAPANAEEALDEIKMKFLKQGAISTFLLCVLWSAGLPALGLVLIAQTIALLNLWIAWRLMHTHMLPFTT